MLSCLTRAVRGILEMNKNKCYVPARGRARSSLFCVLKLPGYFNNKKSLLSFQRILLLCRSEDLTACLVHTRTPVNNYGIVYTAQFALSRYSLDFSSPRLLTLHWPKGPRLRQINVALIHVAPKSSNVLTCCFDGILSREPNQTTYKRSRIRKRTKGFWNNYSNLFWTDKWILFTKGQMTYQEDSATNLS